MRIIPVMFTFFALTQSKSFANEIGNAQELRELLLKGHMHAKIETVLTERGCSDKECTIDIGKLSIVPERGIIKVPSTKQIHLKYYGLHSANDFPKINWDPIRSFEIFRKNSHWGTCLEFVHVGVGASGQFQRWRSVVLVPWQNDNPKSIAYRFVGYWLGCDYLTETPNNYEVGLATLEPSTISDKQLQVIWHQCNLHRCDAVIDSRNFEYIPNSEVGALWLNKP